MSDDLNVTIDTSQAEKTLDALGAASDRLQTKLNALAQNTSFNQLVASLQALNATDFSKAAGSVDRLYKALEKIAQFDMTKIQTAITSMNAALQSLDVAKLTAMTAAMTALNSTMQTTTTASKALQGAFQGVGKTSGDSAENFLGLAGTIRSVGADFLGLSGGVGQLVPRLIQISEQFFATRASMLGVAGATTELKTTFNDIAKSVGFGNAEVGKFALTLAGLKIGADLIQGFAAFATSIANVTDKFNAFKAVFDANKIAGGGEAAFGAASNLANKYGLSLDVVTKNMTAFGVAAKNANMFTSQSNKIFEGVSSALAGVGASTDQANRAFTALQQMMSKGKIMSEELKGQLAEALPGAVQIMAKALGTTTTGLEDMMKAGLAAGPALEKFGAALLKTNEELGKKRASSFTGEVIRMGNSLSILTSAFGNGGLLGALNGFKTGLAGINEALRTEGLQNFAKLLGDVAGIIAGVLMTGITTVINILLSMAEIVGNVYGAFLKLFSMFKEGAIKILGDQLQNILTVLSPFTSMIEITAKAIAGMLVVMGGIKVAGYAWSAFMLVVKPITLLFAALAPAATAASASIAAGGTAAAAAAVGFTALAASLSPIAIGIAAVVAAIAVVSGAFYLVQNAGDILSSTLSTVGGWFTALGSLVQRLALYFPPLQAAINLVSLAWNGLMAVFKAVGITAVITVIKDIVSSMNGWTKSILAVSTALTVGVGVLALYRSGLIATTAVVGGLAAAQTLAAGAAKLLGVALTFLSAHPVIAVFVAIAAGATALYMAFGKTQPEAKKMAETLTAQKTSADLSTSAFKSLGDELKENAVVVSQNVRAHEGYDAQVKKTAETVKQAEFAEKQADNARKFSINGLRSQEAAIKQAKQGLDAQRASLEAGKKATEAQGGSFEKGSLAAQRYANAMRGIKDSAASLDGAQSRVKEQIDASNRSQEQAALQSKEAKLEIQQYGKVLSDAEKNLIPTIEATGKYGTEAAKLATEIANLQRTEGERIAADKEAVANDTKKIAANMELQNSLKQTEIATRANLEAAKARGDVGAAATYQSELNKIQGLVAGLNSNTEALIKNKIGIIATSTSYGTMEEKIQAVKDGMADHGRVISDSEAKMMLFDAASAKTAEGLKKTGDSARDAASKVNESGTKATTASGLWDTFTQALGKIGQSTPEASLNKLNDVVQKVTPTLGNANTKVSDLATALSSASSSSSNAFTGLLDQLQKVIDKAIEAANEVKKVPPAPGQKSGDSSPPPTTTPTDAQRKGGVSGYAIEKQNVSMDTFRNAPHLADGITNTNSIVRRSDGGIPTILHPNEAVIPLSGGRTIPVELKTDSGGSNSTQPGTNIAATSAQVVTNLVQNRVITPTVDPSKEAENLFKQRMAEWDRLNPPPPLTGGGVDQQENLAASMASDSYNKARDSAKANISRGYQPAGASSEGAGSGGGGVTNKFVINVNVSTPDSDSFRKSQPQITSELYKNMKRQFNRNS